MTKPTLYMWLHSTNTDSIYPRSVVLKRICNLSKVDIDIKKVTLPREGPNFDSELLSRLQNLPYMEAEGKKYRTSREIIDYLKVTHTDSTLKTTLTKLDSVFSFITQQWANETFVNSLAHARWKDDDNYSRFIKSINWGPDATPAGIATLRGLVLNYLSRTPIAGMDSTAFEQLCHSQISAIESILEGQRFIEVFAKAPTLSDLNVFMVIQGFLAPELRESEFIRRHCPNILRWFKEVDTLSS